MNLFITELISGIIQVIVLSIIPFLWWIITARKKEGFFHWIGIKKIETENRNCTAYAELAVFPASI